MTEKKNYRAKAASGERDKLYPVFPGIWLAFQDVETYFFSPLGEGSLRPAGDHPLPGRQAGISGQSPGLFPRGGRLIHSPNPKRGSGASLSRQAVPGAFRPDSPGAGTSLHLLLFKGPAMKWKRSGKSPGGKKGSLAGKEIGHSIKKRRLNCAGRISG